MQSRDKSNELFTTRMRLREIEEELRRLGPEEVDERNRLRQEQSELRARLVKLQDTSLKDHDTQEIPGVPGAAKGIL